MCNKVSARRRKLRITITRLERLYQQGKINIALDKLTNQLHGGDKGWALESLARTIIQMIPKKINDEILINEINHATMQSVLDYVDPDFLAAIQEQLDNPNFELQKNSVVTYRGFFNVAKKYYPTTCKLE